MERPRPQRAELLAAAGQRGEQDRTSNRQSAIHGQQALSPLLSRGRSPFRSEQPASFLAPVVPLSLCACLSSLLNVRYIVKSKCLKNCLNAMCSKAMTDEENNVKSAIPDPEIRSRDALCAGMTRTSALRWHRVLKPVAAIEHRAQGEKVSVSSRTLDSGHPRCPARFVLIPWLPLVQSWLPPPAIRVPVPIRTRPLCAQPRVRRH